VLFGKTRRAVLALFYLHPDDCFYQRQVARVAGIGLGSAQRELKRLAEVSILIRFRQGRQVMYRANRDCPIFPELQGLILKTVGLVDLLRDSLAPLAERIEVAFVYGSFAAGAMTAQSDVDLLVVGDVGFSDVVRCLMRVQVQLGRDVNPSVYPTEEFIHKVSCGHHFLNTVLAGAKVFIFGDERELRKLASEQLAKGSSDQQEGDRRPPRRGRP